MKNLSLLFIGLLFLSVSANAQESAMNEDGFNPLSSKQIHVSDIMWKKTIWRAMDLREKQNQPMFSRGKEITKVMIDAVEAGLITPYKNDSLKTEITKEEFMKRMELPGANDGMSEEDKEFQQAGDGGGWGDVEGFEEEEQESGPSYYFPKDLYQLELKEDMIFDKQRSRMYQDIIAVTMFVPADHPDNIKGIQETIASFSYKELHDKVFADNPNAIWYNPQNEAEHHTLNDAFELRLFSSYIIKVSNPKDEYLVDVYGGNPKTGILASQWKEFELLEYEHNLWEF